MSKKILISGIVVLVIGILLIGLGFTGIVGAGMVEETNISDIEVEETEDSLEFKDYDEGDTVLVSGEIVDKEEDPDLDMLDLEYEYAYEIEEEGDTLEFFSDEDVGDVGDEITVTLEVDEEEVEVLGQELSFEYMRLYQEGEPFSLLGIPLFAIVGIILAILGAIIALIGVTKESPSYVESARGKPTTPGGAGFQEQRPRQQWQQTPQQPQDEEPTPQQEQGFAQQPTQQQQVQQEPHQQKPQQQPRQQAQQQPAQQQQPQQSNTCPDCGQPIRYIEEYDSWYCDDCQEYK